MTWVRIDDGYADHPKTQRIGLAASGLFVRAVSHCARYGTDGVVTTAWLRRTGDGRERRRALAELVREGIFEEVEGGYSIHDYLDYNPSRAQVEAARRGDRDRKRRMSAGNRQDVLRWNDDGEALRPESGISRPDPSLTHNPPDPPKGGAPDLAAFWKLNGDSIVHAAGTLQVEAVALAGDTLELAGPPWLADRHDQLEAAATTARGVPTTVRIVAAEPKRRRRRRAA